MFNANHNSLITIQVYRFMWNYVLKNNYFNTNIELSIKLTRSLSLIRKKVQVE